jgi:Mrp family chromosome partitioning ATPase
LNPPNFFGWHRNTIKKGCTLETTEEKRAKITMPTTEQIQQALSQVIDPELDGNIIELGMVRDIQIVDQHVHIILTLTTMGCPLRKSLQEQTKMAAMSVPGVESVTVELAAMNESERQQLKERMSPTARLNHVSHLIAVMSGKGGVGKSSVTALLAAYLRRQGNTVGVLDADLTGPSIPRLFGISGPVRGIPLGILPVETPTGIKVISTNLMLPEEDMAVVWRGPVMSGTIRQFWNDVLWGRLDYLLVDLPPGTSDVTLTAMEFYPLDGVVMVTTPQGLSSMVVRKTVHMSQDLDVPILGIVENMSYFSCPETGKMHEIFGPSHTQEVAEIAKVPVLGRLPIDPELTRLADNGEIEQYIHSAWAELTTVLTEEALPAKSNLAESQAS